MHTYNLNLRTVAPDGSAVFGWYIADGYSLPDAITDAIMHYNLRGIYMGLESHEVLR